MRPQLNGKGMSREDISYALRNFTDGDEHPVFWGYFPAYDWVVFAWLFGGMKELPFHFPQLCFDIKQWAIELGDPGFRSRTKAAITRSPTRNGRKRRGRFSPASIPPEPIAEPPNARTRAKPARERIPLSPRLRHGRDDGRCGSRGDVTSRGRLIESDAITGARKKIDNFLSARREHGIVFQKG